MTFMKAGLLLRTGNECCFEIQIDYFIWKVQRGRKSEL